MDDAVPHNDWTRQIGNLSSVILTRHRNWSLRKYYRKHGVNERPLSSLNMVHMSWITSRWPE
jgi:hypothetical protein